MEGKAETRVNRHGGRWTFDYRPNSQDPGKAAGGRVKDCKRTFTLTLTYFLLIFSGAWGSRLHAPISALRRLSMESCRPGVAVPSWSVRGLTRPSTRHSGKQIKSLLTERKLGLKAEAFSCCHTLNDLSTCGDSVVTTEPFESLNSTGLNEPSLSPPWGKPHPSMSRAPCPMAAADWGGAPASLARCWPDSEIL